MKQHIKTVLNTSAARFVVVGTLNTVIDFSILNFFMIVMGFSQIPANIISASVAMTFSFMANRKVVFKSDSTHHLRQIVLFLAVTMSSAYIVQNSVIYLLTEAWTQPLKDFHDIVGLLNEDVFIANIAKIGATGASLVWNFYFYKNLVFKNEKTTN